MIRAYSIRLAVWLMVILLTGGASPAARAEMPLYCELYAPAHFGNWYEVAGAHEMSEYLREQAALGFNRYADWFDPLDCSDPFADDQQYDLANALWDRKKTNFLAARRLGLSACLVVTPNVVYQNQLRPEWLAVKRGRVFGPLICPSRGAARETILLNHRNLFQDLARAGVRLNAISAAPYDYGGCDCEQCRPWIVTFARLTLEIFEIARTYHPGIELRFIGWWWTVDEHRQFASWMDEHAPGMARSIALHIPYERTGVSDVALPRGCERHAFVHIGYAEQSSPRDVYGRLGPVIAIERLDKTARELRGQGVTGVMAYSEGAFDDVNKALLAGLWSGKHKTAENVLDDYARRYFHANRDQAKSWNAWLRPWGRPFNRDACAASTACASLSGEPAAWRRLGWERKAQLFCASARAARGKGWPAERLEAVDQFWLNYERLQREVYGTGPLRHILGPDSIDLPWVKEWRARKGTAATQLADPAR